MSTRITQADLGVAALKVGGGLLSGMKALGSLAVAAARGDAPSRAPSTDKGTGFPNIFFSRSAPAASGKHERRNSHGSISMGRPIGTDYDGNQDHSDPSHAINDTGFPLASSLPPPSAAFVTVVDLRPLLADRGNGEPRTISEFVASDHQRVAGLSFSDDGICLSVALDDGTAVRIFQIRPSTLIVKAGQRGGDHRDGGRRSEDGRAKRRSTGAVRNWVANLNSAAASAFGSPAGGAGGEDGAPWHVYDLRRGRTAGVIEDVAWATDGRWVAVGTKKRTVHIFATNPYGGKPDEASHMDGRVRNVNELVRFPLTYLLSFSPFH